MKGIWNKIAERWRNMCVGQNRGIYPRMCFKAVWADFDPPRPSISKPMTQGLQRGKTGHDMHAKVDINVSIGGYRHSCIPEGTPSRVSLYPCSCLCETVGRRRRNYNSSTKTSLLVLDGHIGARCRLVLSADEVRDLLVLGLLDSRLNAVSIDSWKGLNV
jgi:hypothetical protein